MKNLFLITALILFFLGIIGIANAEVIVMDFEEDWPSDEGILGTYRGITFSPGDWRYINDYGGTPEYPLGSGLDALIPNNNVDQSGDFDFNGTTTLYSMWLASFDLGGGGIGGEGIGGEGIGGEGIGPSQQMYLIGYDENNSMLYTSAIYEGGFDGTVELNWSGIRYVSFISEGDDGDGHYLIDDITYESYVQSAPIPEPTTILLLSTGLIGLAGLTRKRSKK